MDINPKGGSPKVTEVARCPLKHYDGSATSFTGLRFLPAYALAIDSREEENSERHSPRQVRRIQLLMC